MCERVYACVYGAARARETERDVYPEIDGESKRVERASETKD